MVCAQIELVPSQEPCQLFGGDNRALTLIWHNRDQKTFSQALSARLYQASSAITVPIGTTPCGPLEILPGQTVIITASLLFPVVKGETRFLIQWLSGTNRLLGTTAVLVYPKNLLKSLRTLLGDEPIAVLDPQNILKPLLNAAAVEFLDLEDANLENYFGKLVIVGPFQKKSQLRGELASQLRAVARKGAAVVWLLPPGWIDQRRDGIQPSYYIASEGKGRLVVAQASLATCLSASPQSQLNLVQLARMALHPEKLSVPDLAVNQ